MKRVTGIGGIFFKAKDAPALHAWYKRHLGIDVQEWVAQHSIGRILKATPPEVPQSGLSEQLKTTLSPQAKPRSWSIIVWKIFTA